MPAGATVFVWSAPLCPWTVHARRRHSGPFRLDAVPGKALASIGGKPMIEARLRRAAQARGVDRTLVATDDARIADAVRRFGGDVVLTGRTRRRGSGRGRRRQLDADVILDVQGDLPLIEPQALAACRAVRGRPGHRHDQHDDAAARQRRNGGARTSSRS
jgi:CTP:molybdopterin cytidylyltransferase MocA